MRHPAIITVLILSLLLVQYGCATPSRWSAHVTEDKRANIRAVGIVVREERPDVTLVIPTKGRGAGVKASQWSGKWLLWTVGGTLAGAQGGLLPGAAIGATMLAAMPVVATAGAVKGAIDAPPAKAVDSGETQVREIIQGQLIRQLEEQVLTQVRDRTTLVAIPLHKGAEDEASHREPVRLSEIPRPADAVLMIRVKSIKLQGPWDVNPLLRLAMEAQATLTDPAGGPPLYTHTFGYTSEAQLFTTWTSNNAELFRTAVDRGLARLAELIVTDVFLNGIPKR